MKRAAPPATPPTLPHRRRTAAVSADPLIGDRAGRQEGCERASERYGIVSRGERNGLGGIECE